MMPKTLTRILLVALVISEPSCIFAAEQGIQQNVQRTMSVSVASDDFIFYDGFEFPLDCTTQLACPIAPVGTSCISGHLVAAGSEDLLISPVRPDQECGSGAVGGACEISLSAHDAVQWVLNPSGSPALAVNTLTVDGCGRFRFYGIEPPGSGTIAIVTDDADTSVSSDFHLPTATFHYVAPDTKTNFDIVTTLATTVDAWTTSAGNPFGSASFADEGVILFNYEASGYPRAGVVVTESGNPSTANDYYFSDTDRFLRNQVDSSLNTTGSNGSGLFVNGSFTNYSGTGGETTGCTWPSSLAATVPGYVVYVDMGC